MIKIPIKYKNWYEALLRNLNIIGLFLLLFIIQPILDYIGLIMYIDILTTIFIFSIFALSMDILLGYVGLLNFGHALFFGMGAYITTYILLWTSLSYLIAIIIAMISGAGIAFLISYVVKRAYHGIPFAFITLALSLIIYFLYRKREFLPISGGEEGLAVYVPEIVKSPWWTAFFTSIFSIIIIILVAGIAILIVRNYHNVIRTGFSLSIILILIFFIKIGWDYLANLWVLPDYARITPNFYYFSLTILFISYLLAKGFTRSPVGQVWVAIRENEVRAEVLGYDVFKYKTLAFMISASFASLAGAIYAPFRFVVSPETVFTPMITIYALIYIVVGGLGTLSGAPLGTAIVTLLERFLIDYIGGLGPVIVGVIFIIIVLSFPHGIIGTLKVKGLAISNILKKFRLGKNY